MEPIQKLNMILVFGTNTGNTEEIGDKIRHIFSEYGCKVDMVNIIEASPELIEAFDFIIMGVPTWDFGGIQEDWEDFEEQIKTTKLTGKTVALYGLGDQRGYGDYFVDAMGWLYTHVLTAGAKVIGAWPTEGYDFEASLATNDDRSLFCGLAIDEDQQIELSDDRIASWVAQLVGQLQEHKAA